jgi:hypothetical protein
MPQHEELTAVIHQELAPITIGMTGDSRLEGRDVAISTPPGQPSIVWTSAIHRHPKFFKPAAVLSMASTERLVTDD